QVGGQADSAELQIPQIVGALNLLLEPAERLGRHRAALEADDVELQHGLHQLVIERLAAAIVEPAEIVVGVPAEGGRGTEQREGLALAVPIGRHSVAPVENAGMYRILELEG